MNQRSRWINILWFSVFLALLFVPAGLVLVLFVALSLPLVPNDVLDRLYRPGMGHRNVQRAFWISGGIFAVFAVSLALHAAHVL